MAQMWTCTAVFKLCYRLVYLEKRSPLLNHLRLLRLLVNLFTYYFFDFNTKRTIADILKHPKIYLDRSEQFAPISLELRGKPIT